MLTAGSTPRIPFATEVATDNPSLWWRLEETSGLPQDSSGNGRHAASSSGTYTRAVSGLVASDPSTKAVQFSGSGSITSANASTPKWWVQSGLTAAFIIKNAQVATLFDINQTLRLRIDTVSTTSAVSAIFATNTSGFSVYSFSVPADLNDGNAHHFALTWGSASGTLKLYRNGTVLGTTHSVAGGTVLDSGSASNLVVGNRFDGSAPWSGVLDELRFFPTELSAARVAAQAAAAA